MKSSSSYLKSPMGLLIIATLLYAFYFWHHIPLTYSSCMLCDGVQYQKLYDYFKNGSIEPIKFPFYVRLIVPFLTTLVPSTDVVTAFHLVNFLFGLLGIWVIWVIWQFLKIPLAISVIGFAWLLLHWVGIIRYNFFDPITVDVPLYLIQALALLLFLKKQWKWFYLLTPFAILEKESFVPIMVVLIAIQIIQHRNENWWEESRHLVFALVLGIVMQKMVIWLMPEQLDQRSSVMALLYHIKLVVNDPSRLIRWFAAIGSAFGVFPALILFRFDWKTCQRTLPMTLGVLSLMFLAFGLTAGEDMTRIMYLGFPFIMTWTLVLLQKERLPVIIGSILLSIPFMRIYPFHVELAWAVDYANMLYVYEWAAYHLLGALGLWWVIKISDKRQNQLSESIG